MFSYPENHLFEKQLPNSQICGSCMLETEIKYHRYVNSLIGCTNLPHTAYLPIQCTSILQFTANSVQKLLPGVRVEWPRPTLSILVTTERTTDLTVLDNCARQ